MVDKLKSLHANWDVAAGGEVKGVLNSVGEEVENEALEEDAKQWSLLFARHVRSQFCQN